MARWRIPSFSFFLLLATRPIDPVSSNVLITEIMRNPNQADDATGEWFELYNTLGRPVNLRDWVLRDEERDRVVIDRNLVVPARGYVVLANSNNTRRNGGLTPVHYVYNASLFQLNRNDQMSLFNANNRRIDRVNWGAGGFPGQPGRSIALRNVTLDNNFGPNWCLSSQRYGAGDRGTPGTANDCPVTAAAAKPPRRAPVLSRPVSSPMSRASKVPTKMMMTTTTTIAPVMESER